MDKVARLSDKQRQELFQETASRMGIHPAVIEKDFWVCWVLNRTFQGPHKDHLIFKVLDAENFVSSGMVDPAQLRSLVDAIPESEFQKYPALSRKAVLAAVHDFLDRVT